jgi:hypothetical protein
MMGKVPKASWLILISFVLLLAGCGGGGGGDGAANNSTQVSAAVGTQGGSITVTDLASPIKGFTVTVPAEALNSTTTITVQTSSESIPLPTGVTVSEDMIELQPSGLSFKKPISVTIPYKSQTPPTIVSHSADGSFSILPITAIDTQNKTVTVKANHFSSFAKIISDITQPISTGFQLGVDTFTINNRLGVLGEGNASCWGFSYYSKWYFQKKKAAEGKLSGKYSEANEIAIVKAAQALQTDFQIADNAWSLFNLASTHDLCTFISLYSAMKITGMPQILLLADPLHITDSRHAVLVYGIKKDGLSWILDVYDSRDNAQNYKITFTGLQFTPWQGYTGGGNNYTYSWFTYVGDDLKDIGPSLESMFNTYASRNITGTVNSGGVGLANVSLSLSGSSTGSATSDVNGKFTFPNAPHGFYTLTPVKSGYVFSPFAVNATVEGSDVQTNFTAQPVYTLSGTIRSGSNTGSVLSGANVTIAGKSATTSATGQYSISGVKAGSWTFSVTKAGYTNYTSVPIAVGTNLINMNYFLLPTTVQFFTVSGTITDLDNNVVAPNVLVALFGRSAVTNAAGFFSISGVPAGTFNLSTTTPGYSNFVNQSFSLSSNVSNLAIGLRLSPLFGSVAINTSTGAYSWAIDFGTLAGSRSQVFQGCPTCTQGFSFGGGTCFAIARGPSRIGAGAGYDTLAGAISRAISECASAGCATEVARCNGTL